MTVGIIDYGSGNFTSVWNAFQKHGRDLLAVTKPAELRRCRHVVLPGVGAFSTAMERLTAMGMVDSIREVLAGCSVPFLGICVGMQVLATRGTEFHLTHGFDVVHGVVTRLDVATEPKPLLLPHMGWNDVRPPSESVLFKGIDVDDPSFYFVHSYALQSNDAGALFSYCEYGKRFIAAAEKGCVFGVQFHPEKSQRNGHRLIANFLGFTNG